MSTEDKKQEIYQAKIEEFTADFARGEFTRAYNYCRWNETRLSRAAYRADIDGDKNYAIIDRSAALEVLECYELVKKEFEKRLETYLKKYGLAKLKVWTYCADD